MTKGVARTRRGARGSARVCVRGVCVGADVEKVLGTVRRKDTRKW